MSVHQIHVFISHSWRYSGHYNTVAGWVFGEKWRVGQASIDFRDFSVPKNDPIHDARNDTQLRNALFTQISRSHVIVIPAGIYSSHSGWIQKEIDGARNYRKPILAVIPWGQQRISNVVQNAATRVVGWNKVPLVTAIWDLYFRNPHR